MPSTPLAIRSRIPLDDATRDMVRVRLGRRLVKYAPHIQRATVRFEDVNGPGGGIDIVCRVKIVLDGLPSMVVEKRAPQAIDAVVPAAEAVRRALRRTLQRAGHASSRGRMPNERRERTGGVPPQPSQRDDEGSLICRRVGRSKANLERALARPEKVRREATSTPRRPARVPATGGRATAPRRHATPGVVSRG